MMLTVFVLCSFALALGQNLRTPQEGLPTVPSLDLSKYIGLWYQMAADQVVYDTFEKDSFCVAGVYGDNGDGTISVHNFSNKGGPTGPFSFVDGFAYQTDPENDPGKLQVVFTTSKYPSPYWVLDLGPVNEKNMYDYAVVSDNRSSSLFILARDVDVYNAKYKEAVEKKVASLGFVGKTAPIETYQGKDCLYESKMRRKEIESFAK